MVKLFYTTYISVDLAHHEICHVKIGKGGISSTVIWPQSGKKHYLWGF